MSVELPEAYILAKQLNKELIGKQIVACSLQDCAKYQEIGFFNIYLSDYNRLCGRTIESVVSRGNTIRVRLDGKMNLLLAPEYGGIVLFHSKCSIAPSRYNFKLSFTDETSLTVRLTGMGMIKSYTDEELQQSYLYKRDFSAVASPIEDDFTFERFSKELTDRNVNLKTVIVGKDAFLVGLGNAAFQDILYRACIHPKRKASELKPKEQQALFNAIKFVVQQRINLGGKNQFADLYGKQGTYIPAMGSNMRDRNCTKCGTTVERLSLGGGQVYFCVNCQK